uniref:Phytanoyl-CoA dioxygenase n=1 Tax=Aureoumbra lagunensis TaxID=44058 RepID=A0A7S3JUK3_9STRA|mmetsp:Transcript_11449/g.15628  ORF Transcript_11449/g.15628 Transcript_11449/m.15628 type:complete len:308 (-) Transcript_11449:105-1028(-)
MYTFAVEDSLTWLRFLREEGYVVLSAIAHSGEVAKARQLLWRNIEELWPNVSENDLSTWRQWPLSMHGIVPELSQSAGAWYVRGIPRVREAFAKIWDDDDLIVSMDSVICWRPWWYNANWKPITEGLHVDQNPIEKPTFSCVQGMMPLYSVTEDVGGLAVVPRSHLIESPWKQRYTRWRGKGDWCPLSLDDPLYKYACFLKANPGDLILWDSRTVHGGFTGNADVERKENGAIVNRLARLSCTVSMVPRSRASASVLELRKVGFLQGAAFNHSPHEAGTSTGALRARFPDSFTYKPIKLTDNQRALL